MKTGKRLLSVILAAVMIFSTTGMTTFAESANEETIVEVVSEETTVEETVTEEETAVEETVTEEETAVEETATEETTVEEIATEETTVEETAAEETTVEETAAEETTVEETVTEETTVEETVTEETTVEETTEDCLFTGLGEDVAMSATIKAGKAELDKYAEDILVLEAGVDYAEGEIMVEATSQQEAERYAEAYNGELIKFSEVASYALIKLPAAATVADAVKASADVNIKLPAAWPNYYNERYEADVELIEENAQTSLSGYADLNTTTQWFHEYIGSDWAWGAGYTGAGVQVAVIDGAVYKVHEDLNSNVLRTEIWHRDSNQGVNLDTTSFSDAHGTHVAGIVAADNNGKGVVGVAPDAKVVGYSVFDADDNCKTNWIIDAVYDAVVDNNDIINMSLGGPAYSSLFQRACTDAYKSGVMVIVAAGNEGTNGSCYPACYKNVVTIGALEASGAASSFSNFGSHVDLAFPGVGIYSTVNNGSYQNMDGTSMASPVAAGVAAVILSANENIQNKTGGAKVAALEKAMKSGVKKSSSSGMGKGTTYLPKALKLSDASITPVAPVITVASADGDYSLNVSMTAEKGKVIFYSINGKTPSFKNGVIVNGQKYNGAFTINQPAKAKVTVKAIAVNVNGKSSKVATKNYTLKPVKAKSVAISAPNNLTTIAQGKKLKLTAAIQPTYAVDKAIEWVVTPADKGVTVKNGTVTVSKTADTAVNYTVTARMKNYTEVNAVYSISVVPAASSVKSVKLASTKATLTRTTSQAAPTVNLAEGLTITYSDGTTSQSAANVVWSSSNTSIATVANGVVTAKNAGTATITALAKDGTGKKAVCKVTVVNNVMSIAISGDKEVARGKSIKLTATITPAKSKNASLVWTVTPADKGVTVKSGKVTASKTADTTVTYKVKAATKDGSVVSSEYSVNVVPGAISAIKFPNKTETIFAVKGNYNAPTSIQLNASITGTEGYDASLVEYTSSAPGVAIVNKSTGLVTAKAPGKTTITCKALDGSNKKATVIVNVNIPMSKLKVAPKGSCENLIAKGKKVQYGVLYYSDFGAPTNTKVK